MTEAGARFCTSCGTQLVEGAAFCASCGAQLAAAPPATVPTEPPLVAPPAPEPPAGATPPPAPPPTPTPAAAPVSAPAAIAEPIVAIVPNAALKSGLMGMKRTVYTLALTRQRVLCAQVTNAMMKQAVIDARDDAKADGKGFFGQWGAQLTAYNKMAARYFTMSPDEILAENPGNFAIDRTQIEKAKLKAGVIGDENTGSSPDKLLLKTSAQKYTFELGSGYNAAREALIEADII